MRCWIHVLVLTAGCSGDILGGADDPVDASVAAVVDGSIPPSFDAAIEPVADAAPVATYAFHGRDEWQSAAEPVTGPAADLSEIQYITIHYNGDNRDLDGDDNVYQDSDYAELLRVIQTSYLDTRGYSLGYNSGIAPDGDEWEIRGTSIRNAANGCQDVNRPGYAIQVTLPTVDGIPPPEQMAGLAQAIERVRQAVRDSGNTTELTINGHRDVRPLCGNGGTACPGDYLYEQIQNGTIH